MEVASKLHCWRAVAGELSIMASFTQSNQVNLAAQLNSDVRAEMYGTIVLCPQVTGDHETDSDGRGSLNGPLIGVCSTRTVPLATDSQAGHP